MLLPSGIVGEGRIPKNHGHPAGRGVDERRLPVLLSEVCRRVAMGTMVFTSSGATVEFFKVAVGGILAGFVVQLAVRALHALPQPFGAVMNRQRNRPAVPAAICSYLIAEHIGFSGDSRGGRGRM